MESTQLFEFDTNAQTPEYDTEKLVKKQRVVRGEFEGTGRYGIPLVRSQYIDLNAIEPWCFVKAKPDDTEFKHKTIHFFTYDWLFETVFTKPEAALEKLEQYYALLTPEFSTYKDMPVAMQMHSTFKNRWCGAFWQSQGMLVIPTITWGTQASYEFCFDGVEQNAIVAVSTYGSENNEAGFMAGYNRMLDALNPSAIICYGDLFKGMGGNVKAFSPYNHKELIAKLGMDEYMRRYLAGDLYPSN